MSVRARVVFGGDGCGTVGAASRVMVRVRVRVTVRDRLRLRLRVSS